MPGNPERAETVAELTVVVADLRRTVDTLRRAVEGDTLMGAVSIRQTLQNMQEKQEKLIAELRAENAELARKFAAFEEERKIRDARAEGQALVIKWLGGSGLLTSLGVIAALVKLFGGN